MFCYVWTHKKTGRPFLGMVNGKRLDHPQLIFEDRARIKILLLDPQTDLPVKTIDAILKMGIDLYD